ncbi:hypothetical protein [Alicycliphilus denitrificans]|uniref:hypothetical protein n=1 Tax=Alicycliphilus denitrificans TaxID=179636 RepID=UPI000C9F884A|nr:hypothetical protein [Alicycliphilus denitrificans]
MQEVAAVIDAGAMEQGAQDQAAEQAALAVKNLFLLLQGSYGTAFMTKYATGVKDGRGHDLGIRATMAVWRAALGKYPPAVIEAAAARMSEEHREFPPSLPQFEALCKAATPRKTWAQENRLPALPPPNVIPPEPVQYDHKGDRKDWARSILAQVRDGIRRTPTVIIFAREALGMEGRQSWQ